jgi:hypothetical protein
VKPEVAAPLSEFASDPKSDERRIEGQQVRLIGICVHHAEGKIHGPAVARGYVDAEIESLRRELIA